MMLSTQDFVRGEVRREHDDLADPRNTSDLIEGNVPRIALSMVEYQGNSSYVFVFIYIVVHFAQNPPVADLVSLTP